MSVFRLREDIAPGIGDVVLTFDGFLSTVTDIINSYGSHYREYFVQPVGNPCPRRSYMCPYITAIACRSCGQVRTAHTDEGKCLYGPGYWEIP